MSALSVLPFLCFVFFGFAEAPNFVCSFQFEDQISVQLQIKDTASVVLLDSAQRKLCDLHISQTTTSGTRLSDDRSLHLLPKFSCKIAATPIEYFIIDTRSDKLAPNHSEVYVSYPGHIRQRCQIKASKLSY